MKTYNDRLRYILKHGKKRADRTGTGTISYFGSHDEYHMFDGFPLYGNRAILLRWIFNELKWMLKGDSNIAWLKERGVTIWDEWAVKKDMVQNVENLNLVQLQCDAAGLGGWVDINSFYDLPWDAIEKLFADNNVTISDYMFVREGDLGPIYPSMWRNNNGVDQIQATLKSIRNHPYSRRHCVSAWNPKYLPKEELSPEENVFEGFAALAPCHHFFQFYVEDLTLTERLLVAIGDKHSRHIWREEGDVRSKASLIAFNEVIEDDGDLTRALDDLQIPAQGISILFHMRSNDSILGAPYNIASYAMLLKMYGELLGMAPMKVVHQVGDGHIYLNHLDKIEEMLDRPVPPLPSLNFNQWFPMKKYKDPSEFEWSDFVLEGYSPGPKVNFKIAK